MNWKAITALVIGCGVAFVGLVYPPVRALYDYAWFVGFGVSFVAYWAADMVANAIRKKASRLKAAATKGCTELDRLPSMCAGTTCRSPMYEG